MKEEIGWVLKWYYDKEGEFRFFIPFYVKAKYHSSKDARDILMVWKAGKDMTSDWLTISLSQLGEKLDEVKPTPEERRDQIKYAFETENYFEGVE
jgi:hypothetical protein